MTNNASQYASAAKRYLAELSILPRKVAPQVHVVHMYLFSIPLYTSGMYILARWLVSALALMATAYLVPGISVSSFYTALIVALVVGFLNAIVRPILIILTLPITIVTFGLFVLVINGAMLMLASTFLKGFSVDSWMAAILGSVVLSVISWIGNQFLHNANHE